MINRNQKYIFTLSFDFIDIIKMIRTLDSYFNIDKEKDYEEQILKYADSIFLNLGQTFNNYVRTKVSSNITSFLNNDIIPGGSAKILSTNELEMYIRVGNNYTGIRLDGCYSPNHCYTLLIITDNLQVIHQLIDVLAINGDSINYILKTYITDNIPTNKEE